MGLIMPVLCLVTLVTLVVVFLQLVRKALMPAVPVKGTTNIPGPTEGIRWPIIGDALWYAGISDMKGMWDAMQRLTSMRKEIISFLLGSKLVIFILDAKLLEKIIKSNKCPDKDVEFYSSFSNMTDGVFSTTNAKRWSDLRRPLDKIMHPRHMNDFFVVFVDKAKMACDKLQRRCGQGVFDVKDIIKYYTLDITLEIFLGRPGTQQLEDTMNLPNQLERVISCALLRMIKPLYTIDWIFQSSSLGRETKDFKDKIRPTLKRIVDECLKQMRDRGFEPNDPNFEPQNYLEATIHVGLRENVNEEKTMFSFVDLIIAGFDTTLIAISSAILYLAMHPDYQEKVYQEQLLLMGNSLEEPTRAELSRMEYLEMVFNETLRKVAVPAIVRTNNAETKIDGYILPEGASIYIWFNVISSDPKYWERPGDFYPDHFLPEKVAERPKCSFMPFSFGSRSCPGRIFGMLSSKLILSMLMRRFKFTTTLQYNEIIYKYMIMLETEQGYPVEATPRDNATGS